MNDTRYIAIFAGALAVVYAIFDPSVFGFFPECPLREATGWLCPGCGTQRAAHHLLNARPGLAFQHNALLLPALPYLTLGLILCRRETKRGIRSAWRQRLYGTEALAVAGATVVAYWILRNLL